MGKRLFKAVAHLLFIAVSAYLYIVVVQFWAVEWEAYFMRSGNPLFYLYLVVFTMIYVKMMKLLWKWQVRAFSGL